MFHEQIILHPRKNDKKHIKKLPLKRFNKLISVQKMDPKNIYLDIKLKISQRSSGGETIQPLSPGFDYWAS